MIMESLAIIRAKSDSFSGGLLRNMKRNVPNGTTLIYKHIEKLVHQYRARAKNCDRGRALYPPRHRYGSFSMCLYRSVLALIVVAFVAGCSLDYSAVFVTESMSEELPDSILMEFTHTSVKNGLPVFRLSAGKAYIYNKKEETRLTDVLFQEYDDNGDVSTEGRADEAVFFTQTEDAEFWGNLLFYSTSEEASFSTAYLYWSDNEKTLKGQEDSLVLIQKDSGTEIRGTGFETEARTRIVTFAGSVSGSYVLEDEEEEEAIEQFVE